MNIDSITNGIVLDHIKAGKSMQIYQDLELDKLDCSVAIIKNVKSNKLGRKDIIKIDQDYSINLDVLGYIDPYITFSYIKYGKTVENKKVELPDKLVNIICCKNPRCITTTEQGIDHIFKLVNREKRTYRCIYCEEERQTMS